jgi:hypothetical protein
VDDKICEEKVQPFFIHQHLPLPISHWSQGIPIRPLMNSSLNASKNNPRFWNFDTSRPNLSSIEMLFLLVYWSIPLFFGLLEPPWLPRYGIESPHPRPPPRRVDKSDLYNPGLLFQVQPHFSFPRSRAVVVRRRVRTPTLPPCHFRQFTAYQHTFLHHHATNPFPTTSLRNATLSNASLSASSSLVASRYILYSPATPPPNTRAHNESQAPPTQKK